MSNLQFQDIIELAEAIDFMIRAQQYRKYRPPFKDHKGHYKAWLVFYFYMAGNFIVVCMYFNITIFTIYRWKYAYQCIVEEDIRRRRNNWDWIHMKRHRKLCKTYANAYYQKLTQAKPKPETLNTLHHCEKELDLFNITLVRKQVEMKVENEGRKKEEEKQKAVQTGGWFSGWGGWFGGSTSAPQQSTDLTMNDILEKVEGALTVDEKAKLYAAIDYTENALPLDYPETYEEYFLSFKLLKLSMLVKEYKNHLHRGTKVLNLAIHNVSAE